MTAFQLALVTGASSGIGRACCQLLASKGISLLITGRNKTALEALKEDLHNITNVDIIIADLQHPEERQILVDAIQAQKPDLIINNAGFGLYGDALAYNTAEQLAILEVDCAAVLEMTLEGARTMIAHGVKGTIVNVSSAAAFYLYPGFAIYAASKAFVNAFSTSFNLEVNAHGIYVLTSCPGMVDTDFFHKAGAEEGAQRGPAEVMSPESVAAHIWKQIEQCKPLSIINWKYRLLTWVSRLLPKKWIAKGLYAAMKKRAPSKIL